MADVFISYSSRHRDLTEELAAYLDGCGLDVWWDRELVARSPFDEQIQEELGLAKCVVVLWTEGAVESEWVAIEAGIGLEADKLVAVRADDLPTNRIPQAFAKIDAHKLDTERDLILRDVLAVREGRLLLEAKDDTLPPPDERKPTDLLQARYGVVQMTGAEDRIQDLVDWATNTGPYSAHPRRAAGRLIHGPGGLGKTRLLIETAARLREVGWSAGFIARPPVEAGEERRARYDKAVGHLIRGARDRGLFLVMDYAEGRDEEISRLAERIRARPADDARPIRLVLLTRAAGDWWERVTRNDAAQTLFGAGHGPGDVHELGGITTPQQRLDLFVAATQGFAQPLADMGYAMPTAEPDSRRIEAIAQGAGYDRPLAIQMEALLYLAAEAPSADEPGVAPLLGRIVDLECEHWPKLTRDLDGRNGRPPIRHMERAVAQVTSVQGVPSVRAAEDLLMADARYPERQNNRGKVEGLSETVTRVYGRGDGRVTQLEPDLVGEHIVSRTADPELIDGCVAWIRAQPEARQGELKELLVTVLQRASQPVHGPGSEKAAAMLDHLIDAHGGDCGAAMIKVMGDTPGALFARLAAKVEMLSPAAIFSINQTLPVLQSPDWFAFSLRVAQRNLDLARKLAATDAQDEATQNNLAAALGTLGIRYSNLKRLEDALAASEEAVQIRRDLYRKSPDVFAEVLASSLNNLGIRYSNLKRLEDALAASEEAVQILRDPYRKSPDVFAEVLASSLNNLGIWYSNLKRLEDALAASEEAVQILRDLYRKNPDVFAEDLAQSLNNLGIWYSNLKRLEDALAASEEAVQILRDLYRKSPDVFAEVLATSLNNLGIRYSNLKRLEDALAASEEAVQIRRDLYRKNPDVFAEDLAQSLNNLGIWYSNLKRLEDALAASEEAVQIRRDLYRKNPDVFAEVLATSLNNISVDYSNLKRLEDALAASEEAVQIRRDLYRKNPDVFAEALASSLNNLGIWYSNLKRLEDALAASEEAVQILRDLYRKSPDVFAEVLASSLNNISVDYSNLKRLEDALAASEEAVQIRRDLYRKNPDVFAEVLATSLNNISVDYSNLKRLEDALAASEEAVQIRRDLYRKNPDVFAEVLATSLNNLGIRCSPSALTGQFEVIV